MHLGLLAAWCLLQLTWEVLDLVLDVHDSQGNARPLRSVWVSLCIVMPMASARMYRPPVPAAGYKWQISGSKPVCSLHGSRSYVH